MLAAGMLQAKRKSNHWCEIKPVQQKNLKSLTKNPHILFLAQGKITNRTVIKAQYTEVSDRRFIVVIFSFVIEFKFFFQMILSNLILNYFRRVLIFAIALTKENCVDQNLSVKNWK